MHSDPNPSLKQLLKTHWGHNSFRPLQEEIIESILTGHDTLALLPTGGGKSICFQVPAMAMEGLCLVISPLIALMKDQVDNLNRRGMQALAVFSGMSPREIDIALDLCVYGDVKFLYVSPERLGSTLFQTRLQKMKVNLIAVDEAHCISQWGYDFRPAYLTIAELRELLPKVPVMALTATATAEVKQDIQDKLHFRSGRVFQKSFERKNLVYVVREGYDKEGKLLEILKKVPGCGIIYAGNRRDTERTAILLTNRGIRADFYHAGLSGSIRAKKQQAWMNNQTRVIVATNAFGMGIDKPDVRFVIHLGPCESLEAYYQEAGRGGRDEKKAFGVLLYNKGDRKKMEERLEETMPTVADMRGVYQALGNYFQLAVGSGQGLTFDLPILDFCSRFNLKAAKTLNCFRFLEKDKYLSFTESVSMPSRLRILLSNEELYRFQIANAKFDIPLKIILRSYQNLFNQYVKIDENRLAMQSHANYHDYIRMLKQLDELQIISYLPMGDAPRVTFLSERRDAAAMRIDKAYLEERKRIKTEKLQQMLAYAEAQNTCRSIILRSYFDEKDLEECGSCDLCLERKKKGTAQEEANNLREAILKALALGEKSAGELISALPQYSKEKATEAIHFLLDEGVLFINNEQLIRNK